MQYRTLGRTNLIVSEIALGCSGFWGNRGFSEHVLLRSFSGPSSMASISSIPVTITRPSMRNLD